MVVTEASAFQSLSISLQRKGIVAGPASGLVPPVQSLVDALKLRCAQVLSADASSPQRPTDAPSTRELYSSIQLWKERSLHQTLQVIDSVAQGAYDTSALQESHIQAIELHENAAKELFELVVSFLQRTAAVVDRQLDGFASQLVLVLNDLIKPELEEQLEYERMISQRLVEQKLGLERAKHELQVSHDSLSTRLDALENAPTGGGDAILCNKLRGRVHKLAAAEKELRERVKALTVERDRCKWEATRLQQKLEDTQHSINLTCAMHEKETKQLVAIAHMNYEQVSRVVKASSASPSPLDPLTAYDANSGRTVVFQNGATSSRSRTISSPAKTRLATMQTPSPPCSPNQKYRLQDSSGHRAGQERCIKSPSPSTRDRSAASAVPLSSPKGEVIRPFAPQRPASCSFSLSEGKPLSH